MKNVACSGLGTMLRLEIQKGKYAMKTSTFQKHIRGTAPCTNRIMMNKKGCGQLTSNGVYFYYIWFGGVKKDMEAMDERVHC